MSWTNRLLLLVNIALALMLGWFLATRGIAHVGQPWTPADLVAILLTAVAVILATLAIFHAVLAVWGYTRLTAEARRTAETIAAREAQATAACILGGGQAEDWAGAAESDNGPGR